MQSCSVPVIGWRLATTPGAMATAATTSSCAHQFRRVEARAGHRQPGEAERVGARAQHRRRRGRVGAAAGATEHRTAAVRTGSGGAAILVLVMV